MPTRTHIFITIGWLLAAALTTAAIAQQPDVFDALLLAAAAWVGGLFTYALVVRSRKMKPRGVL